MEKNTGETGIHDLKVMQWDLRVESLPDSLSAENDIILKLYDQYVNNKTFMYLLLAEGCLYVSCTYGVVVALC